MRGGGAAALRLLPIAFPLFVVVVFEHNRMGGCVVLGHSMRWHPKRPTRQRSRGGASGARLVAFALIGPS